MMTTKTLLHLSLGEEEKVLMKIENDAVKGEHSTIATR